MLRGDPSLRTKSPERCPPRTRRTTEWNTRTTPLTVLSGQHHRVIRTRVSVENSMTRFGLPTYLRTDRNRVMVSGASVPW